MTELLLSILALILGPLFVVFAGRLRSTAIALDAFVLVAVGGLVLLHIVPQSILQSGWPALICCVLGFFAPVLTETIFRPGQRGVLGVVLILALAGLAAHSVLDGIGLSTETGGERADHKDLLAWAIILHRLPVGIGIWWIIPRTLGRKAAVMAMAVCIVGSLIGYGIGEQSLPEASRSFLAWFQAFLGGSLLHVVSHAHVPPPSEGEGRRRWHLASALGAVSAIAVLAFIVHDHAGDLAGSGKVFFDLARESAPALLLAYLLVGLSKELMPQGWIHRIARGSKVAQAMRGVAIGLPLPICSCGILPLYRELIVRGAPSAAALAFLIATPELEVAAILLTLQLMGPEMALTRILAASVLALSIGLLLGKAASNEPSPSVREEIEKPRTRKTPAAILRAALQFGYGSVVDHTAPWILVGLGISALLLPHIDPSIWAGNNLDVPIAAALGLPIYVCASGSTPLVAVLVMQGLSPGAALAFLLTGPATNFTTFGMLRQLHGTRVAAAFALSVLILACALGYAADYLLAFSETAQQTQLGDEHQSSMLGELWLWALAAIFLASLLRQGTRPFVEQLFQSPGLKPPKDDHSH